jgi:predicted RNase H-like nuclease (RuvC/YqgF family)
MNIDWGQVIITAIITFPGVWALIKQLKKEKFEADKVKEETKKVAGADTTKTYAEAARITGEQNIQLYERIEKLEKRVDALFQVNCEKDEQIVILRNTIEDKDSRISELEKIVAEYEQRIHDLEKEVEQLRSQKGG